MLRLRGLGDDPSSGPSAADQISELILASTPIVTSAITGGNNPYGSYYGTPYNNPNYSQYGINVGVSTGPDVPLTQRAWFWPAIFGLGALAIWKMGDNRGRR